MNAPARSLYPTAHAFKRPASRVVVDLVGAPIGAIAFLGFALMAGIGAVDLGNPLFRIMAVAVFGFFGLFMAAGSLATLRRGVDRVILRVGPEGMWTPEMGFLAWPEIAEVRLERVRGFDDRSTVDYLKIGIVPLDASRTAAAHRSLAYRMYAAYMDFVRRARPQAGVQDPEALAPFGVFGYELGGSVGAAVDAVLQYHAVRMPDGSLAAVTGDPPPA